MKAWGSIDFGSFARHLAAAHRGSKLEGIAYF
jgi:hypothetical protein